MGSYNVFNSKELKKEAKIIMKNKGKKIVLLLLVITVMTAISCFAAGAAETFTEGIYSYTVTGEKATVTAVDKTVSGKVEIPETLGGYPVTAIGSSAFEDCTHVESIVICEGITEIPDYAFIYCRNLSSVTIPDTVTFIGKHAFAGCYSLESIELPEDLEIIDWYAFAWCKELKSIVIPDKIKYIDQWAFYECTDLEDVVLPENLIGISYQAFAYCESLKSITIPHYVSYIGSGAFMGCENLADVYYNGTQDEWSKMEIKDDNECLFDAELHLIHNHIYAATTTPVSCTANGKTDYICYCGDSYSEIIPATGHDYQNGICTKCGDNKADDCSHMCHKSGFMGFIWKIVQFFWKLFKMNPVCECGAGHY